MIATSDMVGAYAPPAVHSPDTSAICGQKYELKFQKVGAVMIHRQCCGSGIVFFESESDFSYGFGSGSYFGSFKRIFSSIFNISFTFESPS
jgi:hypothetical protein